MRPRNTASQGRQDASRRNGTSFFREVISELRRSTWPSREEAMRLTAMVIVVGTVMGLFLWFVDSVFSFFIRTVVLGG